MLIFKLTAYESKSSVKQKHKQVLKVVWHKTYVLVYICLALSYCLGS